MNLWRALLLQCLQEIVSTSTIHSHHFANGHQHKMHEPPSSQRRKKNDRKLHSCHIQSSQFSNSEGRMNNHLHKFLLKNPWLTQSPRGSRKNTPNAECPFLATSKPWTRPQPTTPKSKSSPRPATLKPWTGPHLTT